EPAQVKRRGRHARDRRGEECHGPPRDSLGAQRSHAGVRLLGRHRDGGVAHHRLPRDLGVGLEAVAQQHARLIAEGRRARLGGLAITAGPVAAGPRDRIEAQTPARAHGERERGPPPHAAIIRSRGVIAAADYGSGSGVPSGFGSVFTFLTGPPGASTPRSVRICRAFSCWSASSSANALPSASRSLAFLRSWSF